MIKEQKHRDQGALVTLRNDHYGKSLQVIEELFEEALKDFPELSRDDVQLSHYAGMCYKGTYGIEFTAPNDVPSEYQVTARVEFLLG